MIRLLPNIGVRYLVGGPSISDQPQMPYASNVCDFLDSVSKALLNDIEARNYSDLITFGYWCRRSNIERFKSEFGENNRLGLGIVFHIAPANVPINFVFTYAFGLLAGNANIVRLPALVPQVTILCRIIDKALSKDEFSDIRAKTVFVRFEADNVITTQFSSHCRARVIWGGDETVNHIRKLPLPSRAIDVTFADRYSLSILSTLAVKTLTKVDLEKLAARFFNDTYIMDQNACSSPHLILWLGEKDDSVAERFWEEVRLVVKPRYPMQSFQVTEKYIQFCLDAIEMPNTRDFIRHGSEIYRVELANLSKHSDKYRGRFGYFYECNLESLNDLTALVNERFQTLTYFGVSPQEIQRLILERGLIGIDRIVPIGQALDMGVIWDGIDVIKTLSRVVEMRL